MSGAAVDRTVVPTPEPQRPFGFPAFQRLELAPGLTLIAAPRTGVPLVSLELIVPAGATLDPAGKSGLAAMAGAMLDEGTELKSSFEVAAAAERIGGYLSTTTDWDTLSIETGVVAAHAPTALELTAEVLRRPTFPEDELARLRERCLAEIQRRQVFPASLAARQFSKALYGESPYGWPVLGTAESVASFARDDLTDFYERGIASAPVILIAVGDLEPEGFAADARRLLAPDHRPTPAPDSANRVEPRDAARIYLVDRPEAAQSELRIGHVGIARADSDFIPLTVMNSLLGGKFTSRLTLNLRERHGVTYGVHSGFSPRRGPGPFTISTAVGTGDARLAVGEIRRELERLRDEPVSQAELDETRSYLLGVFPYTVQSLGGIAHRLREIAVHELPLDHWDRYQEAIGAVSAADVQRVAGAHLHPDRLTVVAVGPEAELRPQLEPLGEPVVWRPAEEPEPV